MCDSLEMVALRAIIQSGFTADSYSFSYNILHTKNNCLAILVRIVLDQYTGAHAFHYIFIPQQKQLCQLHGLALCRPRPYLVIKISRIRSLPNHINHLFMEIMVISLNLHDQVIFERGR